LLYKYNESNTNLTREVNGYDTSHMPFGLQVFYYPFFLP